MEDCMSSREGPAVLFSFRKELTLECIPELREKIQKTLEEGRYTFVILDLSEVAFIDSSGIGFLVAFASELEAKDRSLYLYRPRPQVLKTLELVQLSSFFKILRTDEERAALLL
ncbi:STAS domain-containing protein [Desulfobaculum bizertense]|uniref:Anti-sigma factor antagonist n=1 Tax=Desulfobaculum bizertense DSM 18034 TaxID=1121442 RepID=A0A1T4VYC0_9BACT|nr:STAS domain-containing protein [Desulfobaculum bizertense]UIJ36979.1 STAS domain-containing protein [Desulfobaculum bizertense]SKA69927.1 anti-sigma B factor antagonist [Desulfobaculum bizertense DSM 18034]